MKVFVELKHEGDEEEIAEFRESAAALGFQESAQIRDKLVGEIMPAAIEKLELLPAVRGVQRAPDYRMLEGDEPD